MLFRSLEKYLFRLPHDIIVGEDGPVTYACMLEASGIYFCDEAYYYYRSNAGSLSHKMNTQRLSENHTMFETYGQFIDQAACPLLRKQLHYFFVYQSLLTFVPVFGTIRRESSDNFRQLFLAECDNAYIREAFRSVPVKDITGFHNRLYAVCVRFRLPWLFRLLLRK